VSDGKPAFGVFDDVRWNFFNRVVLGKAVRQCGNDDRKGAVRLGIGQGLKCDIHHDRDGGRCRVRGLVVGFDSVGAVDEMRTPQAGLA
jgi:hypothetical protein